jgi:hypothetical protein
MTGEQSLKLKPGDRVYFNGYESDQGTVNATNAKYVTTMATRAIPATMT